MKRRVLIVTESLQMNGVLGSLLGFVSALPRDRYDVELMSFDPHIPEWVVLPNNVRLIAAPIACTAGVLYSKDAIRFCLKKRCLGLLFLRLVLPILGKLNPSWGKARLYQFAEHLNGEWDVACGYTMGIIGHFVRTKVTAAKKVLWIHTDPSISELTESWRSYRKLGDEISGIVCVSNGIVDMLKKRHPEMDGRLHCVHNVVDEAMIRDKAASGECVPKREGIIRLVTVGRFCDVKNQQIIPAIAAEVVNRGYRIEWYMIGPGAQAAKGNDMGGVLHYVESMPNPHAMIASADICVQLSKYEGWGLALTEGLVLGRYSIASDIPSFRDQVLSPEHGRLVPISVAGFADAICEAIEAGVYKAARAPYLVPWTAQNTLNEFERIIQ